MPRVVSLFKSKIFKLGILVALFIAAALIVMAMLLGKEAGSFVIRVKSGDISRSIAITEDKDDESTYRDNLSVPGMQDMNDYSPHYFLQADYVTLKELSENTGLTNHDHNSLYIYTFYIVNTSQSGGVGVNVTLNYSNVSNHLDELIRVLTFYQTYNVSSPSVYQKADNLEKLQTKFPQLTNIEYEHYILQPTNFKNDSVVFDDQYIQIPFGDDGYVKYTIMFWLEGDDPDSNYYAEQLYNGTIKFSLNISISME